MPQDLGAQRISDEAVKRKTGRTWTEWRRVLDRAGARAWSHKETATWLQKNEGLSGWWAQSVTVRYEQDAKGRAVGSTSDGTFQVGTTRTFPGDPEAAYTLFRDPRKRQAWLKAAAKEAGRSGRRLLKLAEAEWSPSVDEPGRRVRFHVTGAERSKMIIELRALPEKEKVRHVAHMERIPSATARDDYKAGWKVAMDRLKDRLAR